MTPYQLHVHRWGKCTKCSLCETRDKVVLARGKIPCDVLFIGEAPGTSENVLGRPFVGPAGILLNQMIDEAFERENVEPPRMAFTNLIACIPLGDDGAKTAEPSIESIKACAPRLREFVRIAKPKLIVLVGKLAAKHVQGQSQFSNDQENYPLEWIPRNKFLKFVEIVHPAAILRAPISNQGLMRQRCVVTLSNALDELREGS